MEDDARYFDHKFVKSQIFWILSVSSALTIELFFVMFFSYVLTIEPYATHNSV